MLTQVLSSAELKKILQVWFHHYPHLRDWKMRHLVTCANKKFSANCSKTIQCPRISKSPKTKLQVASVLVNANYQVSLRTKWPVPKSPEAWLFLINILSTCLPIYPNRL